VAGRAKNGQTKRTRVEKQQGKAEKMMTVFLKKNQIQEKTGPYGRHGLFCLVFFFVWGWGFVVVGGGGGGGGLFFGGVVCVCGGGVGGGCFWEGGGGGVVGGLFRSVGTGGNLGGIQEALQLRGGEMCT